MRVLAGAPQGQLSHCAGPICDRRAGFHGVGDKPLLEDGVFHHHIGGGEGRVGIAPLCNPVERLVVGGVLVYLRSAWLHGFIGADHRRERFVVHIDQIQSVFRLVTVLGHHNCHRVTLIPDHIFSDSRMIDRFHVDIGWHPSAGNGVQHAFGVGACVHRHHSWRCFGCGGVNAVDLGVGVRATQHGRVEHPWELNIVGVGCAAGYQTRVFTAPDA